MPLCPPREPLQELLAAQEDDPWCVPDERERVEALSEGEGCVRVGWQGGRRRTYMERLSRKRRLTANAMRKGIAKRDILRLLWRGKHLLTAPRAADEDVEKGHTFPTLHTPSIAIYPALPHAVINARRTRRRRLLVDNDLSSCYCLLYHPHHRLPALVHAAMRASPLRLALPPLPPRNKLKAQFPGVAFAVVNRLRTTKGKPTDAKRLQPVDERLAREMVASFRIEKAAHVVEGFPGGSLILPLRPAFD